MTEKMSEYHEINDRGEFYHPKTGDISVPAEQEKSKSYFDRLTPEQQKPILEKIARLHDAGKFSHLSAIETTTNKYNLMEEAAKKILENREQK